MRYVTLALLATSVLAGLSGCASTAATGDEVPTVKLFISAGNSVFVDGVPMERDDAREAVASFIRTNPGAVVRLCSSPLSEAEMRRAILATVEGAIRDEVDHFALNQHGQRYASLSLPARRVVDDAVPARVDEESCF